MFIDSLAKDRAMPGPEDPSQGSWAWACYAHTRTGKQKTQAYVFGVSHNPSGRFFCRCGYFIDLNACRIFLYLPYYINSLSLFCAVVPVAGVAFEQIRRSLIVHFMFVCFCAVENTTDAVFLRENTPSRTSP